MLAGFAVLVAFCVVWAVREIWKRNVRFPTVAGAIVMASGVLLVDTWKRVELLQEGAAPFVAVFLMGVAGCLFSAFVRDGWKGMLFKAHVRHPVKSFALGTWVAGLAVLVVLIVQGLPTVRWLAVALYGVMIPLWLSYLGVVARNYKYIWQARTKGRLLEQMQGGLLLACVATQAMLVAGDKLLAGSFPRWLAFVLLAVGCLMYGMGLMMILVRYVRRRPLRLADRWENANCIIHGALSITGLAACLTEAWSADLVAGLWVVVCGLFVLVEGIEVVRAVERVRLYGWRRGLFCYSVTQWARNFTFGMLVAFTVNLPWQGSFLGRESFSASLIHGVLTAGTYTVFALFLIEASLWGWQGWKARAEKPASSGKGGGRTMAH
ncbi:MAG TPA: hypothetical protein VFV52_10595 [Bacilli bacterium]|nr:hypothetical protein [Bacilli bacterium]